MSITLNFTTLSTTWFLNNFSFLLFIDLCWLHERAFSQTQLLSQLHLISGFLTKCFKFLKILKFTKAPEHTLDLKHPLKAISLQKDS